MNRNLVAVSLLSMLAGFSGGLRAQETPPDEVVQLPPFLVEEEVGDQPHWLYCECEGLQILSAGEGDETKAFVLDLQRNRQALRQFIPDDFFLQTTLPTTLILFPRSMMGKIDKEMAETIEKISSLSTTHRRLETMHDLRIADPDQSYIFVILKDWQWRTDRLAGGRDRPIVTSAASVRFLMESRTPSLPDWFCVGVSRLYETDLFPELSPKPWLLAMHPSGSPASDLPLVDQFEPAVWLSEDESAALRSDGASPRPILPLRELLVPIAPAEKSTAYRRVWEAECELFVRWAYARSRVDKDLLWRFARLAATHPMDEKLFQSSFRMNYADARDALSDYLPQAVREPLKGAYQSLQPTSTIELRDATTEEIHRIKGEWARRSLRVIKENFPAALPAYIEKTRNLLQRSYDLGERDPPLLASLALFRIDIGEIKEAREIIKQFPELAAIRPVAALANLQYEVLDLVRKSEETKAALSEQDVSKLFAEILAILQHKPRLEGAYILATEVLRRLPRDPTEREREFVNEGAQYFPRSLPLVIRAASWDLRAGDGATARMIVALALSETVDPVAEQKLSALYQLSMASSTGPTGISEVGAGN